ncbi:MAG: carboxypeptidase regulatory-like domain-containing protein [Sandaracinaceae bacterium]|nr:carboxypeptidase regulatory-like domain-containing protein [Myxococcales bacterium]MCB9658274.1 carboxypeptidase regulatory-like domain-containing protein [Sandaracinaceae bacterium]
METSLVLAAMGRRLRPSLAGVLLLCPSLIQLGCGSDAPSMRPIAEGDPCEGPVVFAEGDDGHAEPLAVRPDEVRAGRLDLEHLPDDPRGLNTYRARDFVLANEHVALIVEDVRPSDHFHEEGGMIVGLGRMRDGRIVDVADYGELVPTMGLYAIHPESATVLQAGGRGRTAVVRVVGTMRSFAFLPDLFQIILRGNHDGWQVAIDYSLDAGAEFAEVTIHAANASDAVATVVSNALFAVQANRMPVFAPTVGADTQSGEFPYLVFVDDEGTSYAWESPAGVIDTLLSVSNLQFYAGPRYELPACSVHSEVVGRVHIGEQGFDSVLASIARTRGETLRSVAVHVTDADGAGLEGARVHVQTGAGDYVTRAVTDANGDAQVHLPDGEHQLEAYLDGFGRSGAVDVAAEATSVAVAYPAVGTLTVAARVPGTDDALPARVAIAPLNGSAPSTPGAWGEHLPPHGLSALAFQTLDDGHYTLPPGEYRVTVSRGYEYELHTEDVVVSAGQTTTVTADLEHVVDSSDELCGDFHIHTNRSFDAEDDAALKVRAAAAEGLEVPLRSDHEWVADFEPLIASMGLTEFLYGVVSLELTTFDYGHFGVFPLEVDDAAHNNGAVDWVGRSPQQVFDSVHAREVDGDSPLVIANHAREGIALLGYFTAAGYDSQTNTASVPELWSADFDLLEVFNDSSFDENPSLVADWFAFLNRGTRVFAVGSSDTHQVFGIPLGYPRTCARVGTDEPTALRSMGPGVLRDAMAAGHSVVNGGVHVTARHASGARPGDVVTSAAADELVRVRVQAPQWVDVDTLRVYVGGTLVETITLDAGTVDPLDPVQRFDADVAVPTGGAATWAVFVAAGDTDLAPVHPGRMPFGVTNPIFFEP